MPIQLWARAERNRVYRIYEENWSEKTKDYFNVSNSTLLHTKINLYLVETHVSYRPWCTLRLVFSRGCLDAPAILPRVASTEPRRMGHFREYPTRNL